MESGGSKNIHLINRGRTTDPVNISRSLFMKNEEKCHLSAGKGRMFC